MDVSEQLTRVDAVTVAAVARQALGRPAAQVGRWEHRVAYGGLGVVRGTNSLLRVSGEATDGGRPAPWSAYLKLTRVPPADVPHAHQGLVGAPRERRAGPGAAPPRDLRRRRPLGRPRRQDTRGGSPALTRR